MVMTQLKTNRIRRCMLLALTLAAMAFGSLAPTAFAVPTLVQTVAAPNPSFPTTASDQALWFGSSGENQSRLVLNRTGAIGAAVSVRLRESTSRFQFSGIAAGSNGSVWVAVRSTNRRSHDRLYIVSRTLGVKRVPRTGKHRLRNLARAKSGSVWVRTPEAILRITRRGIVQRVGLPRSPKVAQIASTSDGAVWGVGISGVVRAGSNGKVRAHSMSIGSPIIAASGLGVWIGGETEVVHLDRRLNVRRVPLPNRFATDGRSPRIVIGITPSPDGATWFVSASGYIAKDVVHAGEPNLGTISLADEVTEYPLSTSEFGADVSDLWQRSVAIGSPNLAVGPGSSYAVANFGPGVQFFTNGP